MSNPIPDLSTRRFSANYRRRISFVAAFESGDAGYGLTCSRSTPAYGANVDGTVAQFPINVVRNTDRGVIIETAHAQLLSNSAFAGGFVGGDLPTGWTTTSNVSAKTVSKGLDGVLPTITFSVRYDNSASATASTIGITIESIAPLLPAGSAYCFSGSIVLNSISGASTTRLRIIQRDANSAQTTSGDPFDVLTVGVKTPFVIRSTLAATTTRLQPGLTTVVAAGAVATLSITLTGLQLEPGATPRSFILSSTGEESPQDFYPNSNLGGAVAGNPGTLPTYWSNSSMTSYRVLAVNADDSVDIETTVTATSVDKTGTLRLAVIPGSGSGTIPASAAGGEHWSTSIEATILSNAIGSTPRLNLSGRDTAGNITGNSTTVSLPATGTARVRTDIISTNPGTVSILPSITLTAAAGTTAVVQMRLKAPQANLITLVGATGLVTQPADVVSFNQPTIFSGACAIVMDAEIPEVAGDGTVFAVRFASGHLVRVFQGPNFGAAIELNGAVLASTSKPVLGSPGASRFAVSYAKGKLTIAYPEFIGGGYSTLRVASFNPAMAAAAWLGSVNGDRPSTTTIRSLAVFSNSPSNQSLPLLVKQSWGPRFFSAPFSTAAPIDIESGPVFSVPVVTVTGNSYSAYATQKGKYVARSNGGAAMSDTLPPAGSVGSVEGSPFSLKIVNRDPSKPLVLTCPTGGKIYNGAGVVVSSYTINPGRRICILSDCYSPVTKTYVRGNDNWWLYESADDLSTLSQTYEFVSIYGPTDPTNINRSTIYPPGYAQYHAGIDPVRSFSSSMEMKMNNWLQNGTPLDAAAAMRGMRDACRANYWATSVGVTTITVLPTQVIAIAFAYLGVKDAGIGTDLDHFYIKDWIRDRTEQTIAFYTAQRGAGFTSPGVWAGTATARGNHMYSAGLCAAVAAIVCDRGDFYDFALLVFKQAVEDMMSVPNYIGALVQELARAQKALQYEALALSWLVPLAEVLTRFGFDAYGYQNGALILMINFAVLAIDDPNTSLTSNRVSREQKRMKSLGINGTSTVMVQSIQEPIGFSGQTDPETGDPLVNESRVAWVWLAFRRLTTDQAPWRPSWVNRFTVYDNIYSQSIGGAQSTLYPYPLAPLVPLPPPSQLLDLSQWRLTLPTNSNSELFYNTFIYDDSKPPQLVPNPTGNAARSTAYSPPSLDGFTNAYFFSTLIGGDYETNFVAPVFGSVTTSKTLSNHTRSELRSTLHGSGASATEFRKANRPRLQQLCRVRRRPSASDDINICQIHGVDTYFLIVTLRSNGNLESGMTPPSGTGRTVATLATGVQVGDLIDITLVWGPDDVARYTVSINGDTPRSVSHATDPGWANLDVYFKSGAYHNSDPQESADYSKVVGGLLADNLVTDTAWVAIRSLSIDLLNP